MPDYEITLNNGQVHIVTAANEQEALAQASAMQSSEDQSEAVTHPLDALLGMAKRNPMATGAMAGGALAAPLTGGMSLLPTMGVLGLASAGGAGIGKTYDALANKHVTPSMGEDIADLGEEGVKGAAGALIPPVVGWGGRKLTEHAAERAARPQIERVVDFLSGRRFNPINPLTYAQVLPVSTERAMGRGLQSVAKFFGAEGPMASHEVATKYRPGAGMSSEVPYRMPGGVSAAEGNPLADEMRYSSRPTDIGESSHFGEAGNLQPGAGELPHPGVAPTRDALSRGGDPVKAANRTMGTSPSRFKRPQVYKDIDEILGGLESAAPKPMPSHTPEPELPESWQPFADNPVDANAAARAEAATQGPAYRTPRPIRSTSRPVVEDLSDPVERAQRAQRAREIAGKAKSAKTPPRKK